MPKRLNGGTVDNGHYGVQARTLQVLAMTHLPKGFSSVKRDLGPKSGNLSVTGKVFYISVEKRLIISGKIYSTPYLRRYVEILEKSAIIGSYNKRNKWVLNLHWFNPGFNKFLGQ